LYFKDFLNCAISRALRVSTRLHGRLIRHDLLVIQGCNAIRVHLLAITSHNVILHHALEALLLGKRAIFMGEQERLKVHNLVSQRLDLCTKRVILCAEDLYLLLQVCKPLLLSLSALQRSDPGFSLVPH
jgi:hypothetical protein